MRQTRFGIRKKEAESQIFMLLCSCPNVQMSTHHHHHHVQHANFFSSVPKPTHLSQNARVTSRVPTKRFHSHKRTLTTLTVASLPYSTYLIKCQLILCDLLILLNYRLSHVQEFFSLGLVVIA
mmetsp:Transcript_2315/g.8634  ORF Transcript_2315/g.8634 Transcript_2315/m.8634 type:complete len:123 (+) Transcript_2315:1728-2096(+)